MILGKIRDLAQTKKAKHIRRHARLFQPFSRFLVFKNAVRGRQIFSRAA
jgi:hypothetical protein